MVKVTLEFFKSKKFAAIVAILICAGFAYQNCAKVNFNSDASVPVTGVTGSSIAMVVTGGGLPSAGVTSFTAVPGQSYLFNITGSADAVAAGLNNQASLMTFVSGQCSGSGHTYQPFTMDLTQNGPNFQFGSNTFSYTQVIADQIGGCVWSACVVDNNADMACVTIDAQASHSVTTTTQPTVTTVPTPTTVKITPTTLPPTPTTGVSVTTTTVKITTTTQAPPPPTQPPVTPTTLAPPPTQPPTPTTMPTAWNCYDGFGVCGSGIAIVDNGSVSPNNPGSASIFLKANPSNGAPTQRCQCSAGTKTMISCHAADSTGYYVCAGGSTALPKCSFPGSIPGPYCYYVANGAYWYCQQHNSVAAKTIPCP